jgi:iron complex outermembrane receptor protein
LQQTGITLNNSFDRNNFSLTATQDISKYVTAVAGFNYIQSLSKNPTYQGDRFSPLYDFAYTIPRLYDAHYWRKNYWSPNRDGWNGNDPWGMTSRFFEYFENNQLQNEENYRGFFDVIFNLADWLKLTTKGTMNRSYTTYEDKRLASNGTDGTSNFGGARYRLNESQNLQYSALAMLSASQTWGDFTVNASVATERWHQDRSFHNSQTQNGLRAPGVFELNNSVNAPTTDAFRRWQQRRINSMMGLVNLEWKSQLYLDITGRNDWASTMQYVDGSGNVSYFYPSISTSWIVTETLRDVLPRTISFAKLRASYAIVGKDTNPYFITDAGSFQYQESFNDTKFNTGRYPYFGFSNSNLGSNNLQPEKQHAIEFGFDIRMFNNRLGLDAAYYKTNTKNQIISLPVSVESGISNRIINAGNIQNEGIELLLTGTVIRKRDMSWDLGFNFTKNMNKIIDLYPSIERYRLHGGSDIDAWATVGGAYGDLYTSFAYKRNDEGVKLLNANGSWIRSNVSTKVGNSLPKFMWGGTSEFRYKNLSANAVIDARFGGQIWSGTYNYGRDAGNLSSSLFGRPGHGGIDRPFGTNPDGSVRYVQDGMIPEGVFDQGQTINVGGTPVDVAGMTFQEAMDMGYISPISASQYYANMHSWGSGLREAAVLDISWVALREISLVYDLSTKLANNLHLRGASVGLVIRNVGYLYNKLPDNIHPEGLRSNHSAEFQESGGTAYTRNIGVKVNLSF